MLLRLATTLAVALALAVPAFASAKQLASVRSKTEADARVSASGFLTTPKEFEITISASRGMKITGSVASIQCGRGERSRTKFIGLRGKPRINKKIRPSLKEANSCFVNLSIVGDRPGRLRVRLTGEQRRVPESPRPAPTS